MAPKLRSSSRLVVKTTKKVVKETVEVSVVRSKKRQRKVNDDEHEPVKSAIAITEQENQQTEKSEVSVGKEPAKFIAIESQQAEEGNKEPEVTTTVPVEDASMKTPEKQGGAIPIVDEERSIDTSTHRDGKEPEEESEKKNYEDETEQANKTISMNTQGSETQNFEEDNEPEETPMTPEKKEKNQPFKGEEVKRGNVKQTEEAEEKKDKKRKRRSRGKNKEGGEGYKRYVYKVLKQVHPELGMSAKAVVVLTNYVNDMFERLTCEAAKLTMYTSRKTLSSREIQGAVKLILPGELGKHAMAEGTKAVSNYLSKS